MIIDKNMKQKTFKIIISILIPILILSSIAWVSDWVKYKPFNPLALYDFIVGNFEIIDRESFIEKALGLIIITFGTGLISSMIYYLIDYYFSIRKQ